MSRTVTVGLLADPGLPEVVAGHLAQDLGRQLTDEVDESVAWEVEVSRETLPLADNGRIPLAEHAPRLLEAHGWDAVVYLTDLPRRHDDEPILAEVSSAASAALVCLPALGGWRLTARTRALLVPLIAAVASRSDDLAAAARAAPGTASEHTTSSGARFLLRPGRTNHARLLAGMVRNNRPGRRLLPALSSTAAAGVGTGAFGVFYASIWAMANSLPAARLLLISIVVIVALTFWLIFYNGLWTRGTGIDGRGSPRLDNAATVITVALSVGLMYLMLYAVLFVAALTIITSAFLEDQLLRPVTILDHMRLSWLAASLGTLGGAVGSNFDSDTAIRQATYSRREYQRRQLGKDDDA